MKRFRVRPDAEGDLIEIAEYLSTRATDNTSRRIISRLRRRCRLLSDHPYAGPERPELGAGLRALSEQPYLIVYQIAADGAAEIVGFLHGARDLPTAIAARVKPES